MDEGFDLTHPDLKDRVLGVKTNTEDSFESDSLGHGTHTLGIIGADGHSSGGQLRGLAPDANLIALDVKLAQGKDFAESVRSVERGFQWVLENKDAHNIKVVNCSYNLPTVEIPDPGNPGIYSPVDPLGPVLEAVKEAGILVVAAAGNFADKAPIATPAGHPSVITVGALDTNRTPQDKSDDEVAKFSSRGRSITGEIKPDILAPGVGIMAPSAKGSQPEQQNKKNLKLQNLAETGSSEQITKLTQTLIDKGRLPALASRFPHEKIRPILKRFFPVEPTLGQQGQSPAYIAHDGTSEAAPIVTGVIANMFEANPNLTPEQVKGILFSTTTKVNGDPVAVGRGAVHAQKAIEAARLSANSAK